LEISLAVDTDKKGTIGNIINEEDMPYTKDGLRPDIIINPHAIPSRMTIAQLKETLIGKLLLKLGLFGDGTSFGEMDMEEVFKELKNMITNHVVMNCCTMEKQANKSKHLYS